jgi:hypothetical protein
MGDTMSHNTHTQGRANTQAERERDTEIARRDTGDTEEVRGGEMSLSLGSQ